MNLATAGARARIGKWPHEPDVGHLVLTDHAMVPGDADVAGWIAEARVRGLRAIRTGALFPASSAAFIAAGFVEIDSLLLLELDVRSAAAPPRARSIGRGPTRRLTDARLPDAAAVDQRAFGKHWSNDVASLRAIRDATPSHRARMLIEHGTLRAFAVSGRAGTRGYVQRIAVDPDSRRRGFGRTLVVDALAWMRRHSVEVVLVNTAAENAAALALYQSFGFDRCEGALRVLELPLET